MSGRVVYCIGLENRRTNLGSVSSNLTSSLYMKEETWLRLCADISLKCVCGELYDVVMKVAVESRYCKYCGHLIPELKQRDYKKGSSVS